MLCLWTLFPTENRASQVSWPPCLPPPGGINLCNVFKKRFDRHHNLRCNHAFNLLLLLLLLFYYYCGGGGGENGTQSRVQSNRFVVNCIAMSPVLIPLYPVGTESYSVVHASLEFVILLPQPPELQAVGTCHHIELTSKF